ncbi:helix-turn-helix domain-containing protein [Nocardioides seonyuensis]|uniref:Helix-turn-helix domain-containing protein n=1 Tax=Nocardioides seonyuensis TaxID=2518371 RepID=A0A4P7IHT0_9ACTN|nr:helix-turn-helix domain-containing protein [Nocardioides seonyuensis]QBX56878.1 helix-turn-helix domain-containing protein [Nocardioides seonyuensis]
MTLDNVAALVWDQVAPFELGVVCEAFGIDRSAMDLPVMDFAVCGVVPGRIATSTGFDLFVEHGLDRVAEADLVVVPAMKRADRAPDEALEALRAAVDRGARVMSVCSGAFALGEAGLLDGRECTTHWMYTDELASRFPRATVIPEVLYVDTGQVITSAGSAAGLDASLHLWRMEYGAAAASMVARRMVVPPHREGGQAQFIARPVPVCDSEALAPLLEWIGNHLGEELDVDTLARQMHMSPRTFARRFKEETGTTPYSWILNERVRAAQELLERTDHSIDWVAGEVGFGNAATLRHHFGRKSGVSPQEYRRTFRTPA